VDQTRLNHCRRRYDDAGGQERGVRQHQSAFVAIYRFGRFSALSFSMMVPLLGAVVVSRDLSWTHLAGVAVAAVAFHLFAYVSNDVIDLSLDRTEPLRAESPLVRGVIGRSTALAIALIQVPVLFALHAALRGPALGAVALGAALVLMLIYNIYGKRLSFPPITDAIQGTAWVALALYGGLVARGSVNASILALAALVFVYVLLVNGVHGSLRDLANDHKRGARTTAIYLGARADASGAIVVPRSVAVYGVVLQSLLLVISALAIAWNWDAYDPPAAAATVAALILSYLVLVLLIRMALDATRRPSAVGRAGLLHLFISLGTLIIPFAGLMNRPTMIAVVAVYAVPLLLAILHDGLTLE
jgi:4-hydroxybenzoate polyprenyltransferase